MENPFETIARRLTSIEESVVELNRKANASRSATTDVETDELLTSEETAKLLKVSKVTVWDWTANRGILTKYTIGNQVRYLKSEVLAAVTKKDGTPKECKSPFTPSLLDRESVNAQTPHAV